MIDTFYLDFMIPMALIPFFTLLLARAMKPSASRGILLVIAYVLVAASVLTFQEALNFFIAYRGDYTSGLGASLRMATATILAFPVTFLALAYLERMRK